MLNARLCELHAQIGIPTDFLVKTKLLLHEDAVLLVDVAQDKSGQVHRLNPAAAGAWVAMRDAACKDSIQLEIVSAYRSPEYQVRLIQRHLDNGRALDDILQQVAPPGFSEHHTGRALDLTTPGYEAVEVEFENSKAFTWLTEHAATFRFCMSYPRENQFGIAYEPWHWCFQES